MESSNQFLGTERIGKLMQKYAIPCIISLLVGALYNIVDQIFIANASYLGSYGNAANTVVFPLTVVALAIAVMIGDGCCAFVSISLGQNEVPKAKRSVGNAVVMCLVSSIVLAALYLIFADTILAMFGGTVNAETYHHSQEYFFYITLGVPFYMFGQAMNPIIRADGNPRFAMISTLAGAALNIILDPIFIFGFRWGMMGAAVATVIGQLVTAALAVWYLLHMKIIRPEKGDYRLKGSICGRTLTLGMTSFLSQISLVAAMAAINNMIRKYGALDAVFGQDRPESHSAYSEYQIPHHGAAFHKGNVGVLLVLQLHHLGDDGFHSGIVLDKLHGLVHHQIFQPLFADGLFLAALVLFGSGTFIVAVDFARPARAAL